MFQRVIVVMPGAMESRDALVLGAQSANRDGVVVAANVLASEPAPLDAGQEVYATLGADERVRYITVSGVPLADAIRDLARRERADAIVVGQNAVIGDTSAAKLTAGAPCVVLVAPVGHRFRRPAALGGRNGMPRSPAA